jgi:hypothetical protein
VKTIRVLAQAVGAWLQYEFACNRSNLFNERYLSVPIANALSAVFGHEVRSEFLHPVLAPAMNGPGRRPEVDFAVVKHYPDLMCVVESKWVGSTGLTAADILWDLLRLELIAHNSKVPAYFVLAGRRKNLERFFNSKAFLGEQTLKRKDFRLLTLDNSWSPTIRVANPKEDRRPIFKKLFEGYPEISFPSRIATSAAQKYPLDCPMFQYQAYAWQIFASSSRRFLPKSNRFYGGTVIIDS